MLCVSLLCVLNLLCQISSKERRKLFSLDLFLPTSNSHVLSLLTAVLINVHPLLFVVWQHLESAMAASLALTEVLGSANQQLPVGCPMHWKFRGALGFATSLGYYSHSLDGCSQEPHSGNGFLS